MRLVLFLLSVLGFLSLIFMGLYETTVECTTFFGILAGIFTVITVPILYYRLYKMRGGVIAYISVCGLILGLCCALGNMFCVNLPKTENMMFVVGFSACILLSAFYRNRNKQNLWFIIALSFQLIAKSLNLCILYSLLPQMPWVMAIIGALCIVSCIIFIVIMSKILIKK